MSITASQNLIKSTFTNNTNQQNFLKILFNFSQNKYVDTIILPFFYLYYIIISPLYEAEIGSIPLVYLSPNPFWKVVEA